MKTSRRLPPRIFAAAALFGVVAAFLALKKPMSWLVEAGYIRLTRGQGIQALPLYFTPYLLLQCLIGLTFNEIASRWSRFSTVSKVGLALAMCVTAVGVVYVSRRMGLHSLWVGHPVK